MNRLLEHNVGDFTAVLEAGVPLAEAQATFAEHGQMLAIDPALGDGAAATVGGVIAAGDSGPLRHRYGSMRDLVVGATVALSDGTLARSGGKVIKNVAGYDLAKLFTGSPRDAGADRRVAVRAAPARAGTRARPGAATTRRWRRGACSPPSRSSRLPRRRLARRRRRLLVRFGSARRRDQGRGRAAMRALGLDARREDDDELWTASGCTSAARCVLKVSGASPTCRGLRHRRRRRGPPCARSLLALAAAGRRGDRRPRAALAPRACMLLDAPDELRADAWATSPEPGALAVMARVKERFDPARIFRPGGFVGGI
jgi:glycolate oxidase FAD binding subunit